MARVTGIGGIILAAENPEAMQSWYAEHLGMKVDEHGVWSHYWREQQRPEHVGRTVWEVFSRDADNFKPGNVPFMVNYRVDDLDGFLVQLADAGVEVLDDIIEFPAGRLGWCIDPEGNKVELWEPANEEGQ